MYNVQKSDPVKKYKESSKKLSFLIVDDDQASRDSLKEILEIRGHSVTTLDEGMMCVNRCSKKQFDVIFMDYHIDKLGEGLGELNGSTVVKLVKECFDVDPVVYAYTGDNSTDVIKQCKANNMKGLFVKPVEPTLIIEFLKIIEKDFDDKLNLSKLALKKKNFMYFKKLESKITSKN